MEVSCPSCGAAITFKSRFSDFTVCTFCQSTLVRSDQDEQKVDDIGKMGKLMPDMSPLKIGTRGIFKKSKFEIVGRQKMNWEGGNWNEWYLIFNDNKVGFLAEAQGFYMISFPSEKNIVIPPLSSLKIDKMVKINQHQYTVDDIKEVVSGAAEGEMPKSFLSGKKYTSIDLTADDQLFASISFPHEQDAPQLYLGQYVEFEDLQLSDLRKIDGW